MMNFRKIVGVSLALLFLIASPVLAGEDLVQVVSEGCKTEIDTYFIEDYVIKLIRDFLSLQKF
jgi:hypothetical protein